MTVAEATVLEELDQGGIMGRDALMDGFIFPLKGFFQRRYKMLKIRKMMVAGAPWRACLHPAAGPQALC